jgi:hypothetical protein
MMQADAQSNANGFLTVTQTVVTAIIPALIAAIGFWWRQRRESRDRAHEHSRLILEIKNEIEALGAWISAWNLVDPDGADSALAASARSNLESAYGRLEKSLQASPAEHVQRINFLNYLNIVLIRRKLQGRSAIRMRRFYYVFLAWALVGNFLCAALMFASHPGFSLAGWIFGVLFFWIIFFPWPAVVFYMLTNSRDRKQSAQLYASARHERPSATA